MTDHDQTDRLLRRTLSGVPSRTEGPCLDPETIAAWQEGSLPPAARRAVEAHAADCARCLSVLAAMARTEPATPAAAGWRAWLGGRWLAPLTAAAAVTILAWVVVDQSREPLSTVAVHEPQAKSVPEGPPLPAADAAADPRSEAVPSPGRDARAEPGAGVPANAARLPPSAPVAQAPDAAEEARPRGRARQDANAEVFSDDARATDTLAAAAAAPQALARELAPGVEIVSPDPALRWRIQGNAIQRTTDGGATWQHQFTIAPGHVQAGTAPAPSICWLAGREGLVLLTTDGFTWNRLPFPEKTDLASVAATDGLHATVTASDGRGYRTSDGGLSWTLQETAAAPF